MTGLGDTPEKAYRKPSPLSSPTSVIGDPGFLSLSSQKSQDGFPINDVGIDGGYGGGQLFFNSLFFPRVGRGSVFALNRPLWRRLFEPCDKACNEDHLFTRFALGILIHGIEVEKS